MDRIEQIASAILVALTESETPAVRDAGTDAISALGNEGLIESCAWVDDYDLVVHIGYDNTRYYRWTTPE